MGTAGLSRHLRGKVAAFFEGFIMSKAINSVLALAGNKVAAINQAATDIHAALFHLVHAGQATPLSDTDAALGNRGKASKIRAVLIDYWEAGAAMRQAAKRDSRLDRSGRFTGLNAGNLPFNVANIQDDLTEAVATIKREAKAKPEAKVESEAPTIMAIDSEGKPADVPTLPDEEVEGLRQQLTLARLELAEAHKALAEAREAVLAARTIKQARAVFEQAA